MEGFLKINNINYNDWDEYLCKINKSVFEIYNINSKIVYEINLLNYSIISNNNHDCYTFFLYNEQNEFFIKFKSIAEKEKWYDFIKNIIDNNKTYCKFFDRDIEFLCKKIKYLDNLTFDFNNRLSEIFKFIKINFNSNLEKEYLKLLSIGNIIKDNISICTKLILKEKINNEKEKFNKSIFNKKNKKTKINKLEFNTNYNNISTEFISPTNSYIDENNNNFKTLNNNNFQHYNNLNECNIIDKNLIKKKLKQMPNLINNINRKKKRSKRFNIGFCNNSSNNQNNNIDLDKMVNRLVEKLNKNNFNNAKNNKNIFNILNNNEVFNKYPVINNNEIRYKLEHFNNNYYDSTILSIVKNLFGKDLTKISLPGNLISSIKWTNRIFTKTN